MGGGGWVVLERMTGRVVVGVAGAGKVGGDGRAGVQRRESRRLLMESLISCLSIGKTALGS